MKKFNERLSRLGLSPKRELEIAIAINLLIITIGGVSYYFLKTFIYPGIAGALLCIFNIFYFTRYSRLEIKIRDTNKQEFVMIFTFFKIYIHNGFSVYAALKEVSTFANPNLATYLNDLLSDIDNDKTITPFIKFGRRFDDLVIEEMMISVYQMVDDGNDSSCLKQFEMIFDKISDVSYEREINKKRNGLASMSVFPLIGSGLLILMITFGIITIMGDMINVL